MESGVSGGEVCVPPQMDLSVLSDSMCSIKGSMPDMSRTGRVCRPPGHLILY